MNQKISIKEAIDSAIDECIKDGILEEFLRENREEVCSVLLSECIEQAYIEREEGKQDSKNTI